MARTTATVQDMGLGALQLLTEVAADQANGNDFVNDGNTILVVSNEDGSTASTVTVGVNTDRYGRTKTLSLSCPAGRVLVAGPFAPEVFNTSAGKVNVDFSSGTNVKFAAMRLPSK